MKAEIKRRGKREANGRWKTNEGSAFISKAERWRPLLVVSVGVQILENRPIYPGNVFRMKQRWEIILHDVNQERFDPQSYARRTHS